MKVGIVGLAGSGRSTVFAALTGIKTEVHDYTSPAERAKLHLGTIKVPDARLDKLGEVFHSKKITHSEITFIDMPSFEHGHLSEADALSYILGAFLEADPLKEVANFEMELILRDLDIVAKKLPRMEKELKSQHAPTELKREFELLSNFEKLLEDGQSLRHVNLSNDDDKIIRSYQFLTRKPLLIVNNVKEEDISKEIPPQFSDFLAKRGLPVIQFCAKIEKEIVELDPSERPTFLEELEIKETARDKFIRMAYETLDLVSFFTVKGDEARAWAIRRGTQAKQAAGKIHTDMEHGFIRAEAINYKEFMECGASLQEAKNKGLLRLEGKEYVVQDGDIMSIRFSV